MRSASNTPTVAMLSVTTHVHCQPPTAPANQATAKGPKNWPVADHCCIQPTVVETVSSLGANRTAQANKVLGIKPPTAEYKITQP